MEPNQAIGMIWTHNKQIREREKDDKKLREASEWHRVWVWYVKVNGNQTVFCQHLWRRQKFFGTGPAKMYYDDDWEYQTDEQRKEEILEEILE